VSKQAIEGRIRDLEEQYEVHEAKLVLIEQELHELRLDLHDIHPGDIVTRKGVEYRVTRVTVSSWQRKPWLKGVAKKKNGEWGAAERQLFSDWEKV
jgi:hypothetical protein